MLTTLYLLRHYLILFNKFIFKLLLKIKKRPQHDDVPGADDDLLPPQVMLQFHDLIKGVF